MTEAPVDLATAGDRLYGLPPGEFTAERDRMVKGAKGDKELAGRIKALRRPTAAAHLLNLLARQHPAELAGVIELGSTLRTAQNHRDRDEVKDLGRRRQVLISAVMQLVRTLAAEHEAAAGPGALAEVEGTLRAAMADPAAAAATRSGLLVTAPQADGLVAADVSACVAAPELIGATPTPVAAPEPAENPSLAEQARQARERKAERARAAAREALTEAAAAAERALADRDTAADKAARAREHRAELAETLADLQQRLRATERDAAQAEHEATVAAAELAKAERAAERAEQARDVARTRLDSL